MQTKNIISIDQGTSSTKASLYDENFALIDSHQLEFKQFFPFDGWVEHDPKEILESVLFVIKKIFSENQLKSSDIASIGITNQRETSVLWDRRNGEPIYPAIVWQDRRTSKFCEELKLDFEDLIHRKTGLVLDSYFSATKVAWILNNIEGARKKADEGDLAFGTIDSFLIWHLTSGREHKTDVTNASRTMLFNLEENDWDEELLKLFNIPSNILPEICDNASNFGCTSLFGGDISIGGSAGDQQAALIGQRCFKPGEAKCTFGTGCFVLVNTGDDIKLSNNKLLSTVAYRINGEVTFGLEGSVFVAGSAIQWLRDELNFFSSASETEDIIKNVLRPSKVMVIPAFTGLGAPHWDPDARGAIFGLTRDSGIPEITLATLESISFQARGLIDAMKSDGASFSKIKVDGGMVANDWFNQELANCFDLSIERPKNIETTSLGAAYLAGLSAGLCEDLSSLKGGQQDFDKFTPTYEEKELNKNQYKRWLNSLERTKKEF